MYFFKIKYGEMLDIQWPVLRDLEEQQTRTNDSIYICIYIKGTEMYLCHRKTGSIRISKWGKKTYQEKIAIWSTGNVQPSVGPDLIYMYIFWGGEM